MTPVRAVVLAAGFGKRLRPLTDRLPKAMVPLFNVPMIDFALARLAAVGPRLDAVAINLHHLPEPLVRHVGDGRAHGLRVEYSHEASEILGTGGALRPLEAFLAGGPFLVVNGDVFFELPLERLVDVADRHPEADGVLGLAAPGQRVELGTVATGPDGCVLAIHDRPLPAPVDALRWVFAGAHLLRPRVFDYLPPAGFACIVRDGYLRLLAAGRSVLGVPAPDAAWHDVGTPDSYLQAHRELFPRLATVVAHLPLWPYREVAPGIHLHPEHAVSPGAHLVPPILVGSRARVEAGASVGPDVVLGDGVIVRSGACVTGVVAWSDVEIVTDTREAILCETP